MAVPHILVGRCSGARTGVLAGTLGQLSGRHAMTRKPTWVDGRVDALLAALHDLGMSVHGPRPPS